MQPFKTSEVIEIVNSIAVYNLGCEMLYLIHHRLQKIIKQESKINKVFSFI